MSKKDVLKYLERLSSVIRITFRQSLSRDGLQLVHLEALSYFSTCNKYSDSPQHAAEYLGLTKGTASQSITLLASLGLVEKMVDPRDRRRLHISPAARGCWRRAKFNPMGQFSLGDNTEGIHPYPYVYSNLIAYSPLP